MGGASQSPSTPGDPIPVSLELTVHSQDENWSSLCKPVNLGAKTSLGALNWWSQIDHSRAEGRNRISHNAFINYILKVNFSTKSSIFFLL